MTPSYPQQRGYAVEGVPPVDLASAQREWPGGESRPGQRDMLLGYVRNIHAATVPIRQGAAPAGPATPMDLGTLLTAADPARGERTAQVCAACHTFVAGRPEPSRPEPPRHRRTAHRRPSRLRLFAGARRRRRPLDL